jgi:two-component system sensor histidine kinase KdpD
VQLKRQPVAIDELTGAVLHRLHDALAGREVALDVPADLPLVPCDEVMIEQVLFNLVENAQKHTPPGRRSGSARAPGRP